MSALNAEKSFFEALLTGDGASLRALLADDFELIDVMQGSVIPKSVLVDLVESRTLVFEKIEQLQANPRAYGETVVITGETQMTMRMGDMSGTVHSRYTHVFVLMDGVWRFVSAQGTQIVES
jgi:ketosteroid isomerase-like protein